MGNDHLALAETPGRWLEERIHEIWAQPENSLANGSGERAWDQPLVGFARGDDPLFEAYKAHVGPYHWTPLEIFRLSFPSLPVESTDLGVVCWILPQTVRTKTDNRRETVYPAERWARSRIYGEGFNEFMRKRLVELLEGEGVAAVAPAVSPDWERRDSERFVYASTWSERHIAYACGLGTFGLCDGLITPRGKAVRIGSAVVHLPLEVEPRPYDDPHAYCLFYAAGNCGVCIERCPVGAISRNGHDKRKCSAHVRSTTAFVRTAYGFDGYGCGLCQTGVPCESAIPADLE